MRFLYNYSINENVYFHKWYVINVVCEITTHRDLESFYSTLLYSVYYNHTNDYTQTTKREKSIQKKTRMFNRKKTLIRNGLQRRNVVYTSQNTYFRSEPLSLRNDTTYI